MWSLFALAAVLVCAGGAALLTTSPTTWGVGIIGVACFIGIIARIAQAAEYQKSIRRLSGETAEAEAFRAKLKEGWDTAYSK